MKKLLLILLYILFGGIFILGVSYPDIVEKIFLANKENLVVLLILAIGMIIFFNLKKISLYEIKKQELKKRNKQLSHIERQISSYERIDATGKITKEEKKEWLELTKKHKAINMQKRLENESIEEYVKRLKEL